jgi:hypothetical protein
MMKTTKTNPKSEVRNRNQIRNPKSATTASGPAALRHSSFVIRHFRFPLRAALCAVGLLPFAFGLAASPLGTAFTYQAKLTDGGPSANGLYDFEFTLYDAATNGTHVGGPLTLNSVGVTNGFFTVTLDFGAGVFLGEERWLGIAVRTNRVGGFATFPVRQWLTPAPYALHAAQAGIAASVTGNSVTAQGLSTPTPPVAGQVLTFNGTNLVWASPTGASVSNAWLLGGNAGTAPSLDFLGTTDNQPLEFKVNGQRALRLEPNTNSEPNVIGGAAANSVALDAGGATIGGGDRNTIGFYLPGGAYSYSTIAGGRGNAVESADAMIGGGVGNVMVGHQSAIAGGFVNRILWGARGAAIAGGFYNLIQTNGSYITVESLTNVLAASIGGGVSNTALGAVATIGGGFANIASGIYATIGGGYANVASDRNASVGGGVGNSAISRSAVIAGGEQNRAMTNNATVVGGYYNTASGLGSFVGGGGFQSGFGAAAGNTARGRLSVVSGGNGNEAAGDWATVGGGGDNIASGENASVPGGSLNVAGGSDSFAAGRRAQALHDGAFVWADSTDAAFQSTAANQFCVRANGGVVLQGSGDGSAPQLTLLQTAIDYCRLRLGSSGFPSWDISSQPSATPELRFFNGSANKMGLDYNGNLTIGGTLTQSSDRNAKENITPANPEAVLAKLTALPIAQWNFKQEAVRHLGPMAQDFHAAFGVGADDKHIATVDADGVALAAIQGLNQKLEERSQKSEVRSQELAAKNAALEKEVAELKQRLAALEQLVQAQTK